MSRTSQYTFETVGTTSRRLPPPKNPKDARHLRFRNRNSPTASSCPKTVTARLRLLRARRAPTASVAWSRASSGIESGVDGLPRGLRRFSSRCIPRGPRVYPWKNFRANSNRSANGYIARSARDARSPPKRKISSLLRAFVVARDDTPA